MSWETRRIMQENGDPLGRDRAFFRWGIFLKLLSMVAQWVETVLGKVFFLPIFSPRKTPLSPKHSLLSFCRGVPFSWQPIVSRSCSVLSRSLCDWLSFGFPPELSFWFCETPPPGTSTNALLLSNYKAVCAFRRGAFVAVACSLTRRMFLWSTKVSVFFLNLKHLFSFAVVPFVLCVIFLHDERDFVFRHIPLACCSRMWGKLRLPWSFFFSESLLNFHYGKSL